MPQAPKAKFKHVGIFVTDLEKMQKFYQRWFGLVVTDGGMGPSGKGVFLSSDPTEHHQIVFVVGREPSAAKSVLNQLSFLVKDLPTLKAYYKMAQDEGRTVTMVKSHGNALSIYVLDPEDNQLEIYCNTPWYVSQPVSQLMDLNKSDEEILAQVEREVRANPTFMMRDEWMKKVEQQMAD